MILRNYILLPMPPNTHPIRPFADLVCPLRLPVGNSFETTLTGSPEDVRFDVTFVIIRKILTRMTQMFDIDLCRESERRAAGRRRLVSRELQADEITCGRWGQELGIPERPCRTS